MWQLFSILSLVTKALEASIDKVAMIRSEPLDPVVMSFYRVAAYVAIVVAIGRTGLVDRFDYVSDWRLPLLGVGWALVSLGYTFAIGKLEITNMAAVSYAAPVGFLLVDAIGLGTPLTAVQMAGVVLLALGGIGYSMEGNSRRLKNEISLPVVGILLFCAAYGGAEWYVFKSMHQTLGIGASSFFWITWAWSAIALLIAIVVRGHASELYGRPAKAYALRSVAAKACDAWTTFFAAQALVLASVSQVSAMNSFDPIVLLAVTAVIQIAFRVHLGERFDRRNLSWKAAMTALLFLGWFMVA